MRAQPKHIDHNNPIDCVSCPASFATYEEKQKHVTEAHPRKVKEEPMLKEKK